MSPLLKFLNFTMIEMTLPVGLVKFILPFQLPVLNHAVVPQDLAARDPLVHLVCQITQEQRCVLHSKLLQAEHIKHNVCITYQNTVTN